MAEDVHENGPRTKVLLVCFKYGINVGKYFKFNDEKGHLEVLYSPLGACVNPGDVLVKWRNKDTRKWSNQDYILQVSDVDRAERIKAWFFRKGFDPQDLNENRKVS